MERFMEIILALVIIAASGCVNKAPVQEPSGVETEDPGSGDDRNGALEEDLAQARKKLEESPEESKAKALHEIADKEMDLYQVLLGEANHLGASMFDEAGEAQPGPFEADKGALEDESEEHLVQGQKYCTQIMDDYPEYEGREEVLFLLAYSFDELFRKYPEKGEHATKASETYQKILDEFPSGKHAPDAWLYKAETEFNTGSLEDQPKALEYYTQVTKLGNSPVYAYALYKQAWCLVNMEDHEGAMARFLDVIEHAENNPDDEMAQMIRREASRDLARTYARVGEPHEAWEFFSKHVGERRIQCMEILADAYAGMAEYEKAIFILNKLMVLEPDHENFAEWQETLASFPGQP